MTEQDADALAERHALSPGAVAALRDALRRGGGGAAQWNHPDLGGMGQWSGGGMLQIGDMFNDALKARIRAALEDLSGQGGERPDGIGPDRGGWWPAAFGTPAQLGAQNGMRYAVFPDNRRLAVEEDGTVTVYDTGAHQLTGAAQAQGAVRTLAFSGPAGLVTLDAFTIAP